MSFLDFFRTKKEKKRARPPGRRAFDGAKTDRFFEGWTTVNRSMDAELYLALRTLRARSRDLSINDDYMTRFLNLVRTNVVGSKGIGLQNRAREADGTLDTRANELVENAFRDWGRVGVCTLDGRCSWIDAQNLFAESAARDGEALVRMVKDPAVNAHGFALQFVDVDHLDETFNENPPGGNQIRLSIEYNRADRAVAYHILNQHPNTLLGNYDPNPRTRVPAEEIIHGFITRRAAQGRGYPWSAQGLRRLKMLAGYEEAELIAARVSASKMGFFNEPEGEGYEGDDVEGWDPITYADPGTFDKLPFGVEFNQWDPEHPVSAYEPFVLSILRGAASGFGCSYVSLSGDLRGVSYSSIRQGNLDERDFWRTLQTWMIEHFAAPVFFNWLKMALLTGSVPLPPGKFDKFHAPVWRPRGWTWVDPYKEVNANEKAVKTKQKSLQAVVGEQGGDVEEILLDNQIAEELAAKFNTTLPLLEGGDNGKATP